jgi:hypothetical protein
LFFIHYGCLFYILYYFGCSYNLAMEFQEQVVDAYKSWDTSSSEELREAHRLLEQLRKKAQGSPAAVFPANSLPLLPENND